MALGVEVRIILVTDFSNAAAADSTPIVPETSISPTLSFGAPAAPINLVGWGPFPGQGILFDNITSSHPWTTKLSQWQVLLKQGSWRIFDASEFAKKYFSHCQISLMTPPASLTMGLNWNCEGGGSGSYPLPIIC